MQTRGSQGWRLLTTKCSPIWAGRAGVASVARRGGADVTISQGSAAADSQHDEDVLKVSQGPLTRHGISVVLPAYNEEAVIAETVAHCVAVLTHLPPAYNITSVDDAP